MSDDLTRYRVDPLYGCWLWSGRTDPDGYGIVWGKRARPTYAHRLVWEAERGPIPDGLKLDHVCRRRNCVNPWHLEPVTQRINERRKSWRYRSRASHYTRPEKQTCPRGHDLTNAGMRTPEGGLVCRTCVNAH